MEYRCPVCKSKLQKKKLTAGIHRHKDNTYSGVSLRYFMCTHCGLHSPPDDTFVESWELWNKKLMNKGMIT